MKIFALRKYLIYFVLLLACLSANAQYHSYQLLSRADSTVVPFASILFESRKKGFYADELGRFGISFKQMLDTIKIRSIGFQDTVLILKKTEILGEIKVYLKPKASLLAEVKVFSGNKSYTSMKPIKKLGIMLQPGGVGAQCGLLLTDQQLFFHQVQKVQFYIGHFGNKHFPFRIRIYSIKQGKPDEEITQESIIVHAKHLGWNEFDLSQYHYFVPDGGCLVAMEWLNFENHFDDENKGTSREKYEAQVLGLADYGKGYLSFQKTEFSSWHFNGDYLPRYQLPDKSKFMNPMIRLTVK